MGKCLILPKPILLILLILSEIIQLLFQGLTVRDLDHLKSWMVARGQPNIRTPDNTPHGPGVSRRE